ncbi:M56 family metallopeptidase [Flavobacterium suzhouense]|uniref:M56 family metallopeptidase n=1 Tax=Flavobacterium suzhouense TaxID=1529638 RepID=A0ABW5NTW3_9FLAO
MTDFLIKSTVAMGILLALYHLLFEREKMHRFNRFYLLGALVFSLALPFITVITYVQEVPQANTIIETSQLVMSPEVPYSTAKGTIYKPITNCIPYLAWSVYGVITFLLAIRFIKNVLSFFRKAKDNPTINIEGAKLVLLDEKILPHTFLNYIFINREEYETNSIENELYTHELTHVKQKHTLDILFIEALKTIFWFNPLLYFYKKAIQLNHEFLADEKVIDTTANTVYYQNLLLEKANVGTTFSMASNLTFSLTKKRFIMMTKTTSSIKAGLLKLAIAPVITVMMMLLCTETIAQEKISDIPADKIKTLNVNKKISQKQVDSLRKANPSVYKSKNPADYSQTKVSYTDKKGKIATKSFFENDTLAAKKDNLSSQIKNALSFVPVDKIKTMKISKDVTQQQLDSIKQSTPRVYKSNNPDDYGKMTVEYTDETGNSASRLFFIEQ